MRSILLVIALTAGGFSAHAAGRKAKTPPAPSQAELASECRQKALESLSEGLLGDTISIVEDCRSKYPKDRELAVLEAQLDLAVNDAAGAITAIGPQLKAAPKDDELLVIMAKAYAAQGNDDKAEPLLRQAHTDEAQSELAEIERRRDLLAGKTSSPPGEPGSAKSVVEGFTTDFAAMRWKQAFGDDLTPNLRLLFMTRLGGIPDDDMMSRGELHDMMSKSLGGGRVLAYEVTTSEEESDSATVHADLLIDQGFTPERVAAIRRLLDNSIASDVIDADTLRMIRSLDDDQKEQFLANAGKIRRVDITRLDFTLKRGAGDTWLIDDIALGGSEGAKLSLRFLLDNSDTMQGIAGGDARDHSLHLGSSGYPYSSGGSSHWGGGLGIAVGVIGLIIRIAIRAAR